MDRETIVLEFKRSIFSQDSIPEGFEYIQEEQTYFDYEKGYSDYEVIIKRISDNKFFKGQYADWGYEVKEVQKVWVETFPKQIIKTIYE